MTDLPNHDLVAQLPLTNQGSVLADHDKDSSRWFGVTWHKKMFARATPTTLGLFGMNREYMQERNAGFFILQAHIKCLLPLVTGEMVNVHSRLIDRTTKRLQFMHFMTLVDQDELAATCEVIGAHIDLTERRMAPLPPRLADRFDEVLARHRDLDWAPPTCGAMRP